ncbi:MAG TPA: hypothetical protein PKD91_03435 [Bacteroidia bacterium]|nr:hypothetical protein [Bacteroidia bacterium]
MEARNHNILPEQETANKVVDMPLPDTEEQGVIIVHCHFSGEGAIRIWRSTFLIDKNNSHRSKLLHVENISLAPHWTFIDNTNGYTFTLYFEGLPKTCKIFDLHEIIPQPGGFFIPSIPRNEEDVYRVEIF